MRILLIALTIAALSIGMFATSTQAKGPVEAEVSGGDLKAPIRLDGTIDSPDFFVNGSLDEPLPPPNNIYTIEFLGQGEGGADVVMWTVDYYPAHAGHPAMFKDDAGIFFPVTGQLETMLAKAGLLDDHPAAPVESGTSAAWYALAAALGAVLLLGVGLASRTIARRRGTPGTVPATNR